MIFLRKPKVLFLKAGKVGGTSFEIALSSFARSDDIITPISEEDEKLRLSRGYRGAQNYNYRISDFFDLSSKEILRCLFSRKIPEKFFNHISAAEARRKLGEDLWSESLKVAIVRNPFDRLISQYFWANRNRKNVPELSEWVRHNPMALFNNEQYFIDGKDVIDHYIRYDELRLDMLTLEKLKPELRGLWSVFSGITTKNSIRPKSATVSNFFQKDERLRKSVEFFNEYFVMRFGYQEPGHE